VLSWLTTATEARCPREDVGPSLNFLELALLVDNVRAVG